MQISMHNRAEPQHLNSNQGQVEFRTSQTCQEACIRSKTTRRTIFNAQGRHTGWQNVNMTERERHTGANACTYEQKQWNRIRTVHTPMKVPSAEAKTCELTSSKGLLTSTSSLIETIKGCPREHFVLTSEAFKLFTFKFHLLNYATYRICKYLRICFFLSKIQNLLAFVFRG